MLMLSLLSVFQYYQSIEISLRLSNSRDFIEAIFKLESLRKMQLENDIWGLYPHYRSIESVQLCLGEPLYFSSCSWRSRLMELHFSASLDWWGSTSNLDMMVVMMFPKCMSPPLSWFLVSIFQWDNGRAHFFCSFLPTLSLDLSFLVSQSSIG